MTDLDGIDAALDRERERHEQSFHEWATSFEPLFGEILKAADEHDLTPEGAASAWRSALAAQLSTRGKS